MTAILPLLARYWQLIAGAAAVALIFGWHLHRVDSATDAAREAGRAEASLACSEDRDAAARQRDAQIAAIRKDEAERRAEMESRLSRIRDRNAELDAQITEANRAAERARNEAERQIDEALNTDGLAGCKPTDSVRDGYTRDLSAYRSRHGH